MFLRFLSGGLVAAAVLLPRPGFAGAAEHGSFAGKHKQHICPPYCDPTFGYYPTAWRPWPVHCPELPGPAVAPAPVAGPGLGAPPAEERRGPREPAPEKLPPPKRGADDTRGGPGASAPRGLGYRP